MSSFCRSLLIFALITPSIAYTDRYTDRYTNWLIRTDQKLMQLQSQLIDELKSEKAYQETIINLLSDDFEEDPTLYKSRKTRLDTIESIWDKKFKCHVNDCLPTTLFTIGMFK